MLLAIATVGIGLGIAALAARWMLSRLEQRKPAADSDEGPPPPPPIIDVL